MYVMHPEKVTHQNYNHAHKYLRKKEIRTEIRNLNRHNKPNILISKTNGTEI